MNPRPLRRTPVSPTDETPRDSNRSVALRGAMLSRRPRTWPTSWPGRSTSLARFLLERRTSTDSSAALARLHARSPASSAARLRHAIRAVLCVVRRAVPIPGSPGVLRLSATSRLRHGVRLDLSFFQPSLLREARAKRVDGPVREFSAAQTAQSYTVFSHLVSTLLYAVL